VRIVILSLLLPLVGAGCATEPAAQFSGTDLYLDYCASCHGVNGEGDGQVAGVGDRRMPVWGEVLNWTEDDDTETERIAQQRIAAIVEFLDEIQY
jgi:mono/diheme cytochrome c family protein